MGSVFSSISALTEKENEKEENTFPTQEPKHVPYFGNPVPPEASTTREDSQDRYAHFFETAFCAPHRDGKNVIVCPPDLPGWVDRDYGRVRFGWPTIKIRTAYERLGEDHPRIVRHVSNLEDESIVLERLWPGPFDMTLPVMTVPVPKAQNQNDKMLLKLYYRWALQGLSALGFLHSHGVFLRTFSPQLIWLRSDYSLALTGFVTADITGDTTPYTDGVGGGEQMTYGDYSVHGCVKEDLYYWATFVWRLMTNDLTDQSPSVRTQDCWEPCCPMDQSCNSFYGNEEVFNNRLDRNMYQELEEARLGSVLLKAWNEKYTSADEAAKDIRVIASTMGLVVDGDEVEVDERWEDMLELIETMSQPRTRSFRFRHKLKETEGGHESKSINPGP